MSGLRERKKARTRGAIQDAALALYLKQGYDATTTTQIAEAADVSPATFFRYFPTKEETVLYDRLDPLFIEAFLRQPEDVGLIAALRTSMHEVFNSLGDEALTLEQTRWRLVASVAKLRGSLASRFEENAALFSDAIAERVGRPADDPVVLMWTGALIGAILGAVVPRLGDDEIDVLGLMDTVFDYVESGMPL